MPTNRPDLPRASSAMSGFFFCGMIDDPVAQASSSRAQPNSVDVQSTTSSPSRERWTPSSAAAKQNSAAKSRSLTASMELSDGPVEAELGGDGVRVEPQRGAGQRAGAQRADRRPLVPVLQPVDVAGDRVRVRQQLVGDEHRLGVLQVRHARRGDVLVPLGEPEQRELQRRQLRHQRADVVPQVQPQVGGDLVVAAAPGAELAAERAELLGAGRARAPRARPRRTRSARTSRRRPRRTAR